MVYLKVLNTYNFLLESYLLENDEIITYIIPWEFVVA